MKNKPQTIADLKINWSFDYDCINHEPEYVKSFDQNNSNLKKIKIKPGLYFFQYKNNDLISLLLSHNFKWGLGQFLWALNYELRANSYNYIPEKGYYCRTINSFDLEKFQLLSENIFKIHVKK